jgi:hypothetical protein
VRRAVLATSALAIALACGPVEGTSLSRAPDNTCSLHPCDLYAPGPRTKAVCNAGRCELPGRPDYPFTIVVSVPSSSFFAPGYTFVVPSADLFAPQTPTRGQCTPPSCLSLPSLSKATGGYVVRREASEAVGFALPELLSIPVRVTFVPLSAPGVEMRSLGLPTDVTFASSEQVGKLVTYEEPVPSGQYLRLSYPEAPFDAFFPPAVDEVTLAGDFTDDFTLGARQAADPPGTRQLDDPSGDTRRARVRREEGLDGFRIWIADAKTGRRVSVVRTLSGTDAETRLDTTGQSEGNTTALRDGLDVVVAPPDGWLAAPRLQSTLIGGQGLRDLVYPSLPLPASLSGVVATRTDAGTLSGIPSSLAIESQSLRLVDGTPSPLLRYRTTVFTDESGRFATVLPPGLYDVVIEPAEATGFGKARKVLEITETRAATLEPPLRTEAGGRVELSDGRPLAAAQIFAMPSKVQPDPTVVPRAGRAVTDADGRFRLELDQGSYELTIAPEAGTGFPRLVTIRGIGTVKEDIGTLVVPAPLRLPLTIRAPTASEAPGLPIARAVVRIFAEPAGGGPAVEVGSAMTDKTGKCEILLAQQPR